MDENIVSIVTGASRGIGKGISLRLARENYNLALFGRDTKLLNETARECEKHKVKVLTYSGDAADPEFVNESVKDVIKNFGKVDNLINNAGVAILKKFVDSNLDEFKMQVNTNMYGVFNFTKAVIDGMIERRSGNIINISSLAGKNALVNGTAYSATKHALMGFSRSLMLEVRQYNIRVAIICPGSVNTDLTKASSSERKDANKILSTSDIAETVVSVIKLPVNALISEIDIRPTNP